MYSGKKIQQRISIHARRIPALLIIFSLLFYSYVSANPSCRCNDGNDTNNIAFKKNENCCSSKSSDTQNKNRPMSDVEKSTGDCNKCNESCRGHLTCRDNSFRNDIILIQKVTVQKFLSKYIPTTQLFQTDKINTRDDYFSVFNESNTCLDKIPLTIPLRI
jgi:hypothetical protein